jgi:hypothetical protein
VRGCIEVSMDDDVVDETVNSRIENACLYEEYDNFNMFAEHIVISAASVIKLQYARLKVMKNDLHIGFM